ncbi:MAG: nuclear transport factor 2 family protein [Verrucomicrobia bacterium]|nr:nuclear transport factor 2 family protein [Verrucomicrobiota bacterium]
MNAIGVVQRYFEAWNRHEADAVVAAFAEGGTYTNPITGPGILGDPIARGDAHG